MAGPPPSYYMAAPTPATSTTGIMITDDGSQSLKKIAASMKHTAMAHIVHGALLVIFGIVAIIIEAWYSYFATAIWTGLLIFGMTGLIGQQSAAKESRAFSGGYIAMSIISTLAALGVLTTYTFAANNDFWYGYWNGGYVCRPGGWDSEQHCTSSSAARIAFNCLIVVVAFSEFVLSFCSACYACCYACSCCKSCCDACGRSCCTCCSPTPPPTTAVFTNYGTMIPTDATGVPVGGAVTFQGNYQMPTHAQPGMFVVQQTAGPQGYPMSGYQQQVAGGQQQGVLTVQQGQQPGGPCNPAPAQNQQQTQQPMLVPPIAASQPPAQPGGAGQCYATTPNEQEKLPPVEYVTPH